MVRIGIVGLTGCSGCQCEILNCEEALSKILQRAELAFFPLAKDDHTVPELDLALVEGSVSTELDEEKVKEVRKKSKVVVAVGSCACYGGVQAQRNDEASLKEMLETVYGGEKLFLKVFKPRPVSEVVRVDYELPGCPLDKRQFIYTVASLLNGVKPFFPKIPVCHECKLSETECLTLKGIPCQGPVSFAGCGAPCTASGIGCQGCRGNCDFPNFDEMVKLLTERGLKRSDALKFLKVFRGKTFNTEKLGSYADGKGA
ncbi:NADH ubiquinone oxidoreductase 20 kDa subunit [Thermovibrio ammonificans HB-1]|uniref:NADH ubiquinone oxidoreductase 20 kDa subunit n=1 Tax=Thermovibrio ammonificans (strain DSM 15698 / JCM 12110 / HB-1) TaxID=648996 RepID=E8T5B9_THEA1|nr:NADH ubiquinone oxidoreductase [Thermovibrio ammonificans]ADU96457.1 NADH ubiquinone oxidoreductase 20 kDa subunit [Thermovibrio ammonificans HB-1]